MMLLTSALAPPSCAAMLPQKLSAATIRTVPGRAAVAIPPAAQPASASARPVVTIARTALSGNAEGAFVRRGTGGILAKVRLIPIPVIAGLGATLERRDASERQDWGGRARPPRARRGRTQAGRRPRADRGLAG